MNLVHSIASISFEIFFIIFGVCISDQDSVSHARVVTLPCYLFELSPMNEIERGKPFLWLFLGCNQYWARWVYGFQEHPNA